MAFLVGRQYGIVRGAADNGDELAKDIIQNVSEWSDEELEKALDDFFGKHFDKVESETRNKRYEEVAKRLTGKSEIFNYDEDDVKNALRILQSGDNATGFTEITPKVVEEFIETSKIKQVAIAHSDIRSTAQDNSLKRRMQRRKWIKDEMDAQREKRTIKNDKIALVSLGDAGVGKSSAGGKQFLNQYGAFEIDPDNMKNHITEFIKDYNMLGKVHQESRDMADVMFDQAIKDGANVFVPKTGKKLSSIKSIVDKLKENGYTVYMDFVDLDKEENITRVEARALVSGRYTNPDIIKSSYGKNYAVFEKMKDQVNGWRYFNNGKLENSNGEEL